MGRKDTVSPVAKHYRARAGVVWVFAPIDLGSAIVPVEWGDNLAGMSTQETRKVYSLDEGWLFHLGDIETPLRNAHIAAYMANKAGWARGAAEGDDDDSDWRGASLPHDWAIEGEFSPNNHMDTGYLPRGVGWYRRHFRLEESSRGKYLALQFDGVATHCTVYVNGHC